MLVSNNFWWCWCCWSRDHTLSNKGETEHFWKCSLITYTHSPGLKDPCLDLPLCLFQKLLFDRHVLQICFKRMQWSALLTGSDLTTGMCLLRWDLEMSEIDLCFITMLRSPRKEVLVLCKAQFLPDAKKHGSLHMPQLPLLFLKISIPFLEPQRPACLQRLKVPLLSASLGEGVCRTQALPSPFPDQWIKFLLCYTEPRFISIICNSKQRTHWRVTDLLGISYTICLKNI